MDAIDQLRTAARDRRDELIRQARCECRETLTELNRVASRIGHPLRKHVGSEGGLSSTAHAEAILTERGPLTLLEIAVEAQARGCKPGHTPKRLMHLLRSTMRYHSDRFVKVGERWRVVGET